MADDRFTDDEQRIYDFCMVRAFEGTKSQTMDHCRVGELGNCIFEYMIQVPANRIGFTVLSVAQLKILQEVITLTVFVPFAVFYLKEPLKLDYVWAGLCMVGAVYFMFRAR